MLISFFVMMMCHKRVLPSSISLRGSSALFCRCTVVLDGTAGISCISYSISRNTLLSLYHLTFSNMFSSFLGGSKDSSNASSSAGEPGSSSTAGELHPPHERLTSPESTFGPLSKQDLEWHCSGAFAAETQTFYALTGGKDAKLIMCQVIHSGVG